MSQDSAGIRRRDLPPTKPCHNCRRRRLRCDRSLPACLKCARTGQECMGYGKLFLWMHAVASRGRMTGRPSFAPSELNPTRSTTAPARQSLPESALVSPRRDGDPSAAAAAFARMPTSRTLLDPLMQDLDPSSRLYLHHFSSRLCRDIAPFEPPGEIAFLQLLPMSRQHSFLLHNLVAISAIHVSKITRITSGGRESYRSSQAMIDALSAKQRAISELTRALGDRAAAATTGAGDASDTDAILGALVFFVNFDLVDSGKETWRVHLETAGRLIQHFERSASGSTSIARRRAASPVFGTLFDNLLAMCVAYYIFGSTLAMMTPGDKSVHESVFASLDIVAALKRTEVSNYHSCPAEILNVILLVSRLGSESPDLPPEALLARATALADELVSFDVDVWGASLPPGVLSAKEVQDRKHVALTYRSAAYLYTLLTLPCTAASFSGLSTDDLIADVRYNCTSLEEESGCFNALTWPIFIAGAAARGPEQRQWAKRTLLRILDSVPWGFLMTAIEALDVIWRLRGVETSTTAAKEQVVESNWFEEFKRMNFVSLIV